MDLADEADERAKGSAAPATPVAAEHPADERAEEGAAPATPVDAERHADEREAEGAAPATPVLTEEADPASSEVVENLVGSNKAFAGVCI